MSKFALIPLALILPLALTPQVTTPGRRSRALITESTDVTRVHTLRGNTRSQANSQNDRGIVAENLAMDHMLLQMQRPAEQEQAAQQFVDQLHNPKSPYFHKWLTAAQFGETYGPAKADLDTVSAWLQSQGFTINTVYPSGMVIDFSGTAGQIRKAFHTEIHHLNVNGEEHIANMSDPQIPAALAPAVAGVVAMHDFRPHAMNKRRDYTIGTGTSASQAIVPEDLATIYNLAPLFAAGNAGAGQTIAVIEDTDLYNDSDWSTFRTTFGLAKYTSGSLTTVHPGAGSGRNNCVDPGVANGDDGEAVLDAEWASASAPDATIMVASCGSTRSTFGGMIAIQNLLNGDNPPAIISLSYGTCEAENGASSNAAFNSLFQQAVAEGVSVFVAAGDEGAASCDAGATGASHGIGVSGWASTPYNVAVGGTDFGDSYHNSVSTYWNSANTAAFGSAISYIPEIPWNDSCAGSLLASELGFSSITGSDGLCGSSTAKQDKLLAVAAGSGGPSGCATGTPTKSGIVSGTCQGYAKPSWQSGLAGNPTDSVRDMPDVSLFSGDGIWGHYYVMCWSNIRGGGAACGADPSAWGGAGGTSFASPIMAGIQALVNQKTGSRQGNPNYRYYQLAAQDYGSVGAAACNATNGNTTSSACIFHNVTEGDISVNCAGTQDCYGASAAVANQGGRRGGGFSTATPNGALSTSGTSDAPAYAAGTGWNFATGIGSVNAFNLVNSW
jgi:subtilase family serine protease